LGEHSWNIFEGRSTIWVDTGMNKNFSRPLSGVHDPTSLSLGLFSRKDRIGIEPAEQYYLYFAPHGQ
jgi:hypothetical protein